MVTSQEGSPKEGPSTPVAFGGRKSLFARARQTVTPLTPTAISNMNESVEDRKQTVQNKFERRNHSVVVQNRNHASNPKHTPKSRRDESIHTEGGGSSVSKPFIRSVTVKKTKLLKTR